MKYAYLHDHFPAAEQPSCKPSRAQGGYNLRATACSVEACVRVLLGEAPPPLPRPAAPTAVGLCGIARALAVHSRWAAPQATAPRPAAPSPSCGDVRPAWLEAGRTGLS